MCFLAICMSSLEKCFFRCSVHFLICFLILSCMSCLYILEINPLSVALHIFSPILRVVFCFFVSFALQKLLSLIRSFTTNQLQNVFQCLWGENIRSLCFVPYSVLNANLGASLTCRRFYFRSAGRLLLKTCY